MQDLCKLREEEYGMALRQLVATITVKPRLQIRARDLLLGFDTDLANEGLIAWDPRGFCLSNGLIVWSVIPIGAVSARQVKRRLATRLRSFDCQITWKSLVSGYLYDENMCDCQPPALLLYVGLVSQHDVIHCGGCRGLVALPGLPLSVELREELTRWAVHYHPIQSLWLESGDYETWAARQMERSDSKLNLNGMKLAGKVEETTGIPTYYWLHSYRVSRNVMKQLACPKCAHPFSSSEFAGQEGLYVCEGCRIVWPEPVEVT